MTTTQAESSLSVKKLLIADDHRLVRAGLRAQLEREPDLTVVAEAENGQEALELSRRHAPDLILMDVRMPVMDGLEATRAIKEELPEVSILIVTTQESQDYLLEAIRAGAAGYVLKGSSRDELVGAVRGVLGGESPLNGGLAMRLLKRLAHELELETKSSSSPAPQSTEPAGSNIVSERPQAPPLVPLTDREIEVLHLLAAGKTNPQIAQELVISVSTVKTHVEHIIAKLGVSDRTQAAVRAVEWGVRPG